jgi:cell wall assembly regulator SMI1
VTLPSARASDSELAKWQSCPVAIDWDQLLSTDDGCQLRPSASAGDIEAAEAALEAVFPAELRELYLLSDGVFDAPGQWSTAGLSARAWSSATLARAPSPACQAQKAEYR